MNGLARWQRRFASVALVGGIATVIGAVTDVTEFLRAWLFAYLCLLAFPLGSLAILMTHRLTGGRWGDALRPTLQAASATLPLFILFFVPIALGIEWLYPWADAAHVEHDPLLQHKALYLNVPFFLIRSAIYLLVWNALALLMSREGGRDVSAPGLIVLGLTITFAAIDWIMSLEPHWYSTIFGLVLLSAQALPAFAMAILWSFLASRTIAAGTWNDLGNLLLALVMMWAYIAFSQFFLIWSGNLPEEIVWYVRRSEGGWQWLAWALIACYFFLPFFMLLSRDMKRQPERLAVIALIILVMHVVYHYWLIRPSFTQGTDSSGGIVVAKPHWLDAAALLAVGGAWLAGFVTLLQRRLPEQEVANGGQ
jgi:hypothetical protein